MKIPVCLGIFNRVIFKDLEFDRYWKKKTVFRYKQINVCLFIFELRGFYDFTLGNITIGHYHIYRKQMKKYAFFKKWGISEKKKKKWWLTKKKEGHFHIHLPQISAKNNKKKKMFGASIPFQEFLFVNQYNRRNPSKKRRLRCSNRSTGLKAWKYY